MITIKKIFGFVWAVWGGIWFMLVVIPFTLLYAILFFFTGKRYVNLCVWINCRYLSTFINSMCLIRVVQHHKERAPVHEQCVFVANHLAQIDITVTGSTVPQPVRFLAKSEIKKIPFFGYMTKMLAIMVDRGSKESREKSMRYMVEELKKGNSLFIYPEGTRNRTEFPVKDFKDGAFRTAVMAQVPIVVQTLAGTKEVNNPQGLQLYPGTVHVYWSHPISTEGLTVADIPMLKEKVKAEMVSHLM